jgi:hypothetical protein
MATRVDFNTLSSVRTSYSLRGIDTQQDKIVFNGGGYFNFNTALEGCLDVATKGSSLFYLTRDHILNATNSDKLVIPFTEELLTPIMFGSRFLTFSYAITSSRNIFNTYRLFFSQKPTVWEYFRIRFINKKYCYITYSDELGDFYLALNNSIGVMSRSVLFSSVFSPSGAQFFKYSLNGTSLSLFKDNINTGITQQLVFNSDTQDLSAVDIKYARTISEYSFKVINVAIEYEEDYNTDYIQYSDRDLNIDRKSSTFGVPQNYLIYKNLSRIEALNNIISLKNLQTDRNQYTFGNNLSLTSNKIEDQVKMRSYTSIYTTIETDVDTGLDLNYITYNESISIRPGINYFITPKTFEPFYRININDTTLAKQGCFAGSAPILADKIYPLNYTSRGPIALLCTWLSGGINQANSVWIDRYYYPDRFRNSNLAQPPNTLNTDVLNTINKNYLLSSTIATNNYFDAVSNMVFEPNTYYAYDRVDYSKFSFDRTDDYYRVNRTTYYKNININKGFVLSFNVVNYLSSEFYSIFSQVNDVYGGIHLRFNRDTLYVSLKLYSINTGPPLIIEHYVRMPKAKQPRITVSVNSLKGTLEVYIQTNRVIYDTFTPAFYDNIIYGSIINHTGANLLTLNLPYNTSTYKYNYIDNIFLSTRPLNDIQLQAYIVKQTRTDTEPFYISLPCGVKNNTDSINFINSLQGSTQSKSNAFNININNLNIEDERHLRNIYDIINTDISNKLPVNKTINQINFVS